jgi:hypothetical protein
MHNAAFAKEMKERAAEHEAERRAEWEAERQAELAEIEAERIAELEAERRADLDAERQSNLGEMQESGRPSPFDMRIFDGRRIGDVPWCELEELLAKALRTGELLGELMLLSEPSRTIKLKTVNG